MLSYLQERRIFGPLASQARIFIVAVTVGLTAVVLESGCAAAPTQLDQPHVTLAGVWLMDTNLLEQRYQIRLRIQNPNPFRLEIDGLEYEVEINDQVFARGVSDQRVAIQRYSTALVEVEAISTLADVMRQLMAPPKTGQVESFRYRVRGKLSVRSHDTVLPFDHHGEITLPSTAERAVQRVTRRSESHRSVVSASTSRKKRAA
ncbi:MAG: LEA type 2 family protein [Acidiferrobacterales bacterium]